MYSLQMLRYFRGSYFRGAKLARMSDGSYCIIRDLGLVKGGKGMRHHEVLVTLSPGALESSNVDLASCMVNMIELSRHFDLQVKALHTAEDDGASSAKLLQSS